MAELTSSQVESDHSRGHPAITSAAETDGDTDHFTLVESRRRRRKRMRTTSGGVHNNNGGTEIRKSTASRPGVGTIRSGKCLVMGKGDSGNLDSEQLSAISNFRSAILPSRRKAVFCIDNLCLDATAADVTNFVKNELGVEVLSLYEVKPRKRRFDPEGKLRRAFRICIYEDMMPAFLIDDKWPNRVAVYAWFSKPQVGRFVNLVNSPSTNSQPRQGVSIGHADTASKVPNVGNDVGNDVLRDGAPAVTAGSLNVVDTNPILAADLPSFVGHAGCNEWAVAMDYHDNVPADDRSSSPNAASTHDLNETTLTADISAISDVNALASSFANK
jgi:hypothetical protein